VSFVRIRHGRVKGEVLALRWTMLATFAPLGRLFQSLWKGGFFPTSTSVLYSCDFFAPLTASPGEKQRRIRPPFFLPPGIVSGG